FPGALVLVTHDRLLLDRIATQILSLDGNGGAEFFADLAQALAARATAAASARSTPSEPSRARAKRLSYLEQREFDAMEKKVLAAEQVLSEARKRAEDPTIAADAVALQQRFEELAR